MKNHIHIISQTASVRTLQKNNNNTILLTASVHSFYFLQASLWFLWANSACQVCADWLTQHLARATNTRSTSSSPSCRLRMCLLWDWSTAAGCKYSYLIIHYSCALLFFFPSLSTVYDLLTSPDCLPDLLQGGLAEQGVNEAFILTTFKLQPKSGTSVFTLYNPRDNSKYFEFTVMGKLNRGRWTQKSLCYC